MVIKPELTEKDIKKIGHSLTDKISELQKQVKDFINRTKRRRKMNEYIYKTGGIILDLKSGISYYQDDI